MNGLLYLMADIRHPIAMLDFMQLRRFPNRQYFVAVEEHLVANNFKRAGHVFPSLIATEVVKRATRLAKGYSRVFRTFSRDNNDNTRDCVRIDSSDKGNGPIFVNIVIKKHGCVDLQTTLHAWVQGNRDPATQALTQMAGRINLRFEKFRNPGIFTGLDNT